MPSRLANKLLELSYIDNNGQIIEIINLIYRSISKIIICKAAILNTAVTIDDFKDVNEPAVKKCFNILKYLEVSLCQYAIKMQKSELTAVGKDMAEIFNCS
jgi:hypothetical protein